eukprot:TRINITY_DN3418_c0_g1_i1.p1 TRINITY_DN3418_c0_g1~~TRINITY_DN3418_c0_g1_i1.p1  ORF type:complete len:119 (+),score=6.86 TRINITY_DN3418_c0_g1_i1:82-438(+)
MTDQWLSSLQHMNNDDPNWSVIIPELSPSFVDKSFHSTFVDFLKDDSPNKEVFEEKHHSKLFEIPTSSLNVEVKEQDKSAVRTPWSSFLEANPFIPRLDASALTAYRSTESWRDSCKD